MKINLRSSKVFTLAVILAFFTGFAGCKEDAVEPENEGNINQVQNAPQLITPVNNSTTNNPMQPLEWDALNGAVSYRVQISTDANFITAIIADTALTGTSLILTNGSLNTNIYNYWRVIADLGNQNLSPWSSVWRFRIILNPPPAPVLLYPANNSVNIGFNPVFDWEDAPTAQYYNFQISANQSFSSLILNQGLITLSEFQCPPFILESNSLYFWRVNASNSNGVSVGPWSPVFGFTTVNSPEPGSIRGQVRFVDTAFIPYPGHYIAGAYTLNRWPPNQQFPVSFDSLNIQFVNNEYIANYKLKALPEGDYIIAVLYNDQFFTNSLETMGVYGCDTARSLYSNCAINNPLVVQLGSAQGVVNINFLSWADSSKRIFQ